MSLAEDLLNSLPEDRPAVTSADPATEPHIVINADKTITIPEDLKRILVQHEHNIETVTFDCPRYWDGHDLSQMGLRIVFQRSDDHKEPHPVENLRVDEANDRMIHFDWTISGNTTFTSGNVKITVCAKLTNAEGVSEREWHTIPNQDLFVNEGMDCSGEEIVERNPDVIDYILAELDDLKNAAPANPSTPNPDSGQNANNVFLGKNAVFFGDSITAQNHHYTKGYHAWVAEILGLASYDNSGVSGYSIKDVYNRAAFVMGGKHDLVFVMAGVNDQNYSVPLGQMGDATEETIYGALHLLCAKLKEKWPTSIIVYITPAYQDHYPHNEGVTSYEVSKAIREVCEKFAIPVYDNFALSGLYSTNMGEYTTDNCHWNDRMHEMVGKNLAAYMLNTFHYVYSADSSGGGNSGGDTTIPVTGVTLNAASGTLAVGASTTLTATVSPAGATNKAVSWESSNQGVATVSGGVVTAVSAGSATITATTADGGFTAAYALTVEETTATEIVYSLPEPAVFDGSDGAIIDTGVKLFDTAKDWTLLMAVDLTQNKSSLKNVFACINPENSFGIRLYRSSSVDDGATGNYMLGGRANAGDSYTDIPATATKLAVICSHGLIDKISYRNGDETVDKPQVSSVYYQHEATLVLGKNPAHTYNTNWSGTISQCEVYDGVLSDADVTAFLEG